MNSFLVPRSLWYCALTSGSIWYLMALLMELRTDPLSWNRISGLPRREVRRRPDLVRTGAPYPGRPKESTSCNKTNSGLSE